MPDIARLRLHAQLVPLPVASTPAGVVSHLGAVQAQDYQGALWSIALRSDGATRVDVERAIAEGTIVRTWPMRGTLHFVPAVDARWMLELMTPRIMRSAEGRHRQLELDDATFRHSRSLIEKALTREPVLTRAALFAVLQTGKIPTTGQRGIHILQRLCMERMLCYGPHAEKQPTFTLFDAWIPTSRTLEREDALRLIAERFFVSHGPATVRDFVGWTGLTVAEAKLALHLAQASLERLVVDDIEMWMSNTLTTTGDDEPRAPAARVRRVHARLQGSERIARATTCRARGARCKRGVSLDTRPRRTGARHLAPNDAPQARRARGVVVRSTQCVRKEGVRASGRPLCALSRNAGASHVGRLTASTERLPGRRYPS